MHTFFPTLGDGLEQVTVLDSRASTGGCAGRSFRRPEIVQLGNNVALQRDVVYG